MRYLLDTNIAAMKGEAAVVARLGATPLADVVLSPVVLGELEFGAQKSAHCERNRARLADLAKRLPSVALDTSTSRHYARIRAHLERHGTPIGGNDPWIARPCPRPRRDPGYGQRRGVLPGAGAGGGESGGARAVLARWRGARQAIAKTIRGNRRCLKDVSL